MTLAVIDASVLVVLYAVDDSRRADVVERFTSRITLLAPAHLDAEVVSALRGMALGNPALTSIVPAALSHLRGFPIQRMPLAPLLQRMWELRQNITAYDAAYVALAERLDAVLTTCDARLARATGVGCTVDLIT